MADSLFGPSPAQILYARQKDLADRQAEDYRTYLATAQTPAERTSIMAGRTLTQGFAPLLGLGAGAQDPMLQQASMTQNIISKYGADALTNPDTLDQMAAEFKASGMNNEAFQLAGRAADIRSKIKTPKRTEIVTGKILKERDEATVAAGGKPRYSGVNPSNRYEVDELGNATDVTPTKEIPALGVDQMYVRDDYGEIIGVTAMPGSNLDLQRKAAERAAKTSALEAMTGTARILDTIQDTRETVSKYWYALGLPAKILQGVGWTSKADRVRGNVQSIRSNLGLDQIRTLKELSPTGSTGLGQVSNIELNALQTSIAALDQNMTEEDFLYQLEKIEQSYLNLVDALNNDAIRLELEGVPELKQLYVAAGLLRADGSDPATTPDKPNVKDYRPEGARTSTEEERRASGTITMGQQ